MDFITGAISDVLDKAERDATAKFDELTGVTHQQGAEIAKQLCLIRAELRRAGGARHEGFATVPDESTALAYRQAGLTSSNETRRALIEADVDSATILLFEIESWQRRLSTGLDHLKPFIRNRIAAGHA